MRKYTDAVAYYSTKIEKHIHYIFYQYLLFFAGW